jgi:hypothetical protein
MSMRITQKVLDRGLEDLNRVSKKKYIINGAYGKVQLCISLNGQDTRDGITEITPLLTKRELYDVIYGIIRYIEAEQNNYYKDAKK